jgi:hypothetical protein
MGFYTGVCVGICCIIITIIILANKLPPIDCTNPVTAPVTTPAAPVSNQPQPYSEGIAPAPTAENTGPAPTPDPLGRWATPGWAQPSDGTLRAPTSSGYQSEF